ncbi:MAG: gamma carbonic anhydrase family protein [Alphaproteobacteria bacterium]|nr:MAG: gamma carbonic anhydrase family protein [Alphaproteobacteria bacterium]
MYRLGDDQPIVPEDDHYWIAPNAVVVGRVKLALNASVWFGAVLRGDNEWIEVGENSNVQDCAILHTDPGYPLSIGASVTIGHAAVLHGCQVGNNSLIGIGSIVLNGAKIGDHCLIGANTLIPNGKAIPDGSLVMGSPGKIVRDLNDEEIALLSYSAEHYVEKWQRYRQDLEHVDKRWNP